MLVQLALRQSFPLENFSVSRVRESIADLRSKSYRAIGIKLPIGNCPPDSCIKMGSIPYLIQNK